MSTVTTPNIDAPTMQQRGTRSTSTRKTAVFVGLLFLTATAAFIFAEAINSRMLSQPNFLADASSQTTMLATGALLLFGQFGVVGIAVLLFPLLKRHGESLALAHVGFRVTELAATLFYLAVPLLAIELGAGLSDGTVDGSASSSLGALLQAQHHVAILMIYIATGAAGICMATLLYRSRLIPRWLAILGLVTYPTLLAGSVLDMFNVVDMTQGDRPRCLGPGRLVRVHSPGLAHCQGIQRPRPRLTTQARAEVTRRCRSAGHRTHQRSTTMEHIHGGPMAGRTVLVTGATSGIGRATALGLATMGAHVAITGRDRGRTESAAREISAAGGRNVEVFVADLSSQAQVRRLASEVLEGLPRIHVLVNNVGGYWSTRHVTADGLERTFAVNHLAPFLLTNLLLDRLEQSAPARVVTVASNAHATGTH